jgi:ribosome-binding protein aMBF1 (putative translation factor)
MYMEAPYVEQAVQRVIRAVGVVKKSELARRAGVPESTLRDLGKDDWTPNAATLQKLEEAAIEIERERADEEAAA